MSTLSHYPINAIYYPSWRIYKGHVPSAIPVNPCSHIFYAFARPQLDGSIALLDPHADLNIRVPGSDQRGCIAACVALKRSHPHLKVILSVGGASGSAPFSTLACNAATRTRFAASARALVDEHGFDGIDIDWEHPSNAEQGRDYLKLMTELRTHLPRERYVLSTALPVGEYVLKYIDIARLASVLDLFNLMAYDFSGPWTGSSGHHAQLFAPAQPVNAFAARSGAGAVEYLASRGMQREKIVLGIPTYARWFRGVSGAGQKFHMAGEVDLKDVSLANSPESNIKTVLDTQLVAASQQIGDDWMSLDTAETVGLKADYAKRNGLGGVFFWTSYGDQSREESLIAAAAKILYHAQGPL